MANNPFLNPSKNTMSFGVATSNIPAINEKKDDKEDAMELLASKSDMSVDEMAKSGSDISKKPSLFGSTTSSNAVGGGLFGSTPAPMSSESKPSLFTSKPEETKPAAGSLFSGGSSLFG